MNIVFFSHPTFLASQSMPRYTAMLAKGMRERGHSVEVWSPTARVIKLPFPVSSKKWLGYVDQYLLFPQEVRSRSIHCSQNTIYVFTDNALGPWVPLAFNRPHVIHCHDFMAQQSAKGSFRENPTTWTGKQYQAFIRRGYSKGKNFVSVSQKTQDDLHRFLPSAPLISEVVYNGLNPIYKPLDIAEARILLGHKTGIDLRHGYLLHVGGNQWYKNRKGVIELYDTWRAVSALQLPLLLVGGEPMKNLAEQQARSTYKSDIHFIQGLNDEGLHLAYAGASVFLFPSLAEGFGWPIAEAMASGCLVITTNEAPMTEVAGEAAFLITRRPSCEDAANEWAERGASVLEEVLCLSDVERANAIETGLANVRRFQADSALDKIERIYSRILESFGQK